MSKGLIRDASANDLRRIAEIHISSWREAYKGIMPQTFLDEMDIDQRLQGWERRLNATDHAQLRVCDVGGHIAGWHYSGPSRDVDAQPLVGEVYAIYVDPNAWGLGHGTLLINDAHQLLVAAGFTNVSLWVLKENRRAIDFYARNG